MIAIVDYNVGNLASVTNAFKRQGMDVKVTRDPQDLLSADGIILPGVGAFPVAMDNLQKVGLIEPLTKAKEKGTPMMGICLGMQILFEQGYEVTTTKGLGFLKGEVKLMEVDAKLPHMGWNQLVFNHEHPLLKYVDEGEYVYFVHSYGAVCPDDELMAYAQYGHAKVPALVAKDNVIGCQFHPEKSGEVGTRILKAFKEMIER